MLGGTGNDVIKAVGNLGTTVFQTIDAGEGDDRVEINSVRFTGFEALKGGAGIDTIKLTSAVLHQFTATSELNGFEQLDGSALNSVLGTAEEDHIDLGSLIVVNGTNGVRVDAGAGADSLGGTSAKDYLYGGDGNDYIYGDAGNDEVQGNENHDYIEGGDGDDWLQGNNGDDSLWGDAGDDTLEGGSGENKLIGGDGNDKFLTAFNSYNYVEGGEGNDTFDGSGRNVIDLGAGDDLILARGGTIEHLDVRMSSGGTGTLT